MTDPVINVSIMAHPARRAGAEAIRDQIHKILPTRIVYDPEPNGLPGTMRTARLAWRPWHPDATHHLVLQDDAELRPDFAECLIQVAAAQPDRWISLACEWGCKTAWTCRAAGFAHRPFAPVVDSYTPLWGLLVPSKDASELADHLDTMPDDVADDVAIGDYRDDHRLQPALITVPNLLAHGNAASLIGNDNRLGQRGTALTVDLPIPRGWWQRPILEPAGLPTMIYFAPTKPLTLRHPGHFGWDTDSTYYSEDERGVIHKAIEDASITMDLPLQRAFETITLAMLQSARNVQSHNVPKSDGFSTALISAGVTSCVNGMLRRLLPDDPVLARSLISLMQELATDAVHGDSSG